MITITDKAAIEIKAQGEKTNNHPSLRIGIRGGGCTGFSQIFEWGKGKPDKTDKIFEKSGVFIYIDPKSYTYLEGSEIDFETSMMGHGFKINSPKATGHCGCGSSVSF